MAGLRQAFRMGGAEGTGYCAIGSVKGNVGHLDAAAGVTGLIKTALSLWHGQLPASINYNSPNPKLGLETSPFFVNSQLRPWPRGESPRRAGVSSFGVGGTNAHVVVEEAPLPVSGPTRRSASLLVVSARLRTPADLRCGVRRQARAGARHGAARRGFHAAYGTQGLWRAACRGCAFGRGRGGWSARRGTASSGVFRCSAGPVRGFPVPRAGFAVREHGQGPLRIRTGIPRGGGCLRGCAAAAARLRSARSALSGTRARGRSL
ncbi:MAG: hypothetical protein IPM70_00090 [Proteobacteria bacterium]|nr:hypothetical protein [Pseudomonadota bacterium]